MKMTVFGTGYLGATHAACMAELGHEVLGVDVDPAKIEALQAGTVPFFEPGLQEVLTRNLAAGRLRFTTDCAEAAAFANVHFLGVGTPQRRDSYAADLTQVNSVVETLVPLFDAADNHLIIGKSTVPVGTAARLQQIADDLGSNVEIAWNPEFLREGFAVEDTINPDRIVLGVRPGESSAEQVLREVFEQPLSKGTPFLVTDLPTAELVKVSANAFLATKISFINAVAEVCEIAGADVTQLADAIGFDERIGRKFLGAGLGFGGGCLPKDIRAFMARAGELGASEAMTFLKEVDAINMRARERMVQLTKQMCGGSLMGRRVTVLGAAFKPNSDDVRDSPALHVAGALTLAGALVTVFDPEAMNNAAKVYPTLNYAANVTEALQGADVVVLTTEWQEFKDLDPAAAAELVEQPVMIDGRNALDAKAWRDAGWTYCSLGVGTQQAEA